MAKTFSLVVVGVEPRLVEIETFVGAGFSGLTLLGLPGEAARDMRERVRSALESVGVSIPARRVVVNVSPALLLRQCRTPLEQLDFAVAACIVRALDRLSEDEAESQDAAQQDAEVFAGELSLSGELRPLALPLAFSILGGPSCPVAAVHGKPVGALCLPPLDSHGGTSLRRSQSFQSFSSWFCRRSERIVSVENEGSVESLSCGEFSQFSEKGMPSRAERVGGELALFAHNPLLLVALMAASAGRLNILLAGEPGVGKSFAISSLNKMQAPLSESEENEVSLIFEESAPQQEDARRRSFRTPHHSCSAAALVGGANLRPGEVTLAHRGILFLDELAEFSRPALEALREPLDHGKLSLCRAGGVVALPAEFQLCATTNPCPCGFLLSRKRACRCSQGTVRNYLRKLSGPILDRFCIKIWVDKVSSRFALPDPFQRVALEALEGGAPALGMRLVRVQEEGIPQRPFPTSAPSLLTGEGEGSWRQSLHQERLASVLSALFPEVEWNEMAWNALGAYQGLELLLGKACP